MSKLKNNSAVKKKTINQKYKTTYSIDELNSIEEKKRLENLKTFRKYKGILSGKKFYMPNEDELYIQE
jgi:hypothetical protein